MAPPLDLTFYPYLALDAIWSGIPIQRTSSVPAWQWSPGAKLAIEGTLDNINQLVAEGWECLSGKEGAEHWLAGQLDGQRYLKLVSLLGHIHAVQFPGQNDFELWARTEDIRRAEAIPVTLAWAWLEGAGITEDDFPDGLITVSEQGLASLRVAQVLPPPQYGEIALVDHTRDGLNVWQIYTLAELGESGRALWQRMGAAIKALAAPGEWWPHTRQLEGCIKGLYPQLREALRSKLLATRGKERETWRARLAQLEIDQRHAKALRTAADRALSDRTAWLARWEEIRQMAAELAEMYWQAHQSRQAIPATVVGTETTVEADVAEAVEAEAAPEAEAEADMEAAVEPVALDTEGAAMLAQLVEANEADSIDSTSYQEDRAVREASLAPKADWQPEADIPRFKASNNLAVYYMDREHPLSLTEAQAQLVRITPSTMLTMRIALGLWNIRRHNAQFTRNGRVAITYDEILAWRGVKKHSRLAHPGTGSDQRRTDGYRTENKDGVREDFMLASRYWLRGTHTIGSKGRYREVNVDAPYLHVAFVSATTLWGTEEPLGVFIEPGDWIGDYEDANNYYLAEIDRRIFQLNPQNELHELKIALYLTERWREQAREARYADPITMAELLRLSVIKVDYKHLTDRFAPRIEQAIENLERRGIASFKCLTPVDTTKGQWGKDWLAARWRILPPDATRQNYVNKGITQQQRRQLPPGRKRQ